MAFLDRLVADVIQNSTGFNARSFVRTVGGKNMILLGGAAIAGALAIDKMRQSDQSAASDAGAPPPLPPLPNARATPELPPLPPPIPPPQELVYAIVRTMVSAALADGGMHAEEKKLIDARLGESGLSSEQIEQVRKDLVVPATANELSATVTTPDDRETLFRFGALVVLADDTVTDQEKTWLENFASALGIESGRRRSIESDLFEEAT